MRIERALIKNFRLLESVEISFEPVSTIIVGRNNSGKTSLTEVFDRLIGDKAGQFKLEDFSATSLQQFVSAKALKEAGHRSDVLLAALPEISVEITVEYAREEADLGPLSEFIIDLDTNCTSAKLRIDYRASLQTVDTLFAGPDLPEGGDATAHLFKGLRETIPKVYALHLIAIDPTDASNTRVLELKHATALLQYGFVGAQRALDQFKKGDPYVLGKLLETLFQTAADTNAAPGDQNIAADLKLAVEVVEKQIHDGFSEKLRGLLPAFDIFGYPGLNDPNLRTETSLNVESLLKEHTRVYYTGQHGVHLPEGYNGLGTRNLIYILLQLLTFHKSYRARPTQPGIHLIFIEEPEAHLHPQMQEVFIKQLDAVVGKFSEGYPNAPKWSVQFVVSTHSSHLANAAAFEAIRYFLSQPATPANTSRQTRVKDFRRGLNSIPVNERNFLHQYMTLTKCDLYFADKAILIEGTTERLLMPRICKIVDAELDDSLKLAKQYVSVVEVDGAHSHFFDKLLDFLELKTLIVTDLDAVKLNSNTPARWVKCPYSDGVRTSNGAIRSWFNMAKDEPLTLEALKAKTEADKLRGYRRIAYQVHEPGSSFCARSYEDALVLANPEHFGLKHGDDWGIASWDLASDMSKTATALEFALEVATWNVPHYMKEGLKWLAAPPPPPPEPTIPTTEMVDA